MATAIEGIGIEGTGVEGPLPTPILGPGIQGGGGGPPPPVGNFLITGSSDNIVTGASDQILVVL